MKSKSQPGSVVRRRSLRLASKSNDTPPHPTHDPETPAAATADVPVHNEEPLFPNVDRSSDSEEDVKTEETEHSANRVELKVDVKGTGKRKSVDLSVTLTLRSGKKVSKGIVIGRNKGKVVQEDTDVAELVSHKGKGKLVSGNILLDNADDGERWKRRLTREEKGKGVMVEEEFRTHVFVGTELNEIFEDHMSHDVDTDIDNDMGVDIGDAVPENVGVEEEGRNEAVNVNDAGNAYMTRFRNIARRNAVRFAHFNAETGEANIDGPTEPVRLSTTATVEAEDWPGPFSTAMKIIKDRANKGNVQLRGSAGLNSCKDEPLWVPKQSVETERTKVSPPSLEDLSLDVLVKNVDAISSLTSVPDMMRHKLCQALSDSRKMNGNLFRLLLSGSPMEVRVRDSSWLTEEDFMEHFAGCDTSNLTVLQLDQCGRCMPDYVVHDTMARSSNKLPVLAALSLQAACRLSDSGLSAIASAAPRLQSINLSQCSLLTSAGIQSLTRSLGSILKELYIDDCQSIDIMECLPSLKQVKCLEVLSVAGIESVCDDFIKGLMIVHGQCLKELILTDCMNLTDISLKAIAENSSSLCALNLVNISNLTDIGLGYLANGILKFKILKFCRNKFSDEALAAFVETCGDFLEELWLNSINMVGRNTAVSLAKHSRKLVTLDISWCRNLTDDAVGLIVDSCDLKILKIFGCTQLTDVFFKGHSNPNVQVIGRKMTPIIKYIKGPNPLQGPLRYSSEISV